MPSVDVPEVTTPIVESAVPSAGGAGDRPGRGRHTTSYSQLFGFRGGHVVDTPGMQTFGYPGDDELELAGCFQSAFRHKRSASSRLPWFQ